MNEDPFDKEFEAAFEEAARNREWIPDLDASWARVEAKLNRRRRRRARLRVLPYLAASFILGALIFSSPAVSNAFQPLFRTFVTVQEGVTHIVFGTQAEEPSLKDSVPPPPSWNGSEPAATLEPGADLPVDEVQNTFSTWEEAASSIPFLRPFEPRIPPGFKLLKVMVDTVTVTEPVTSAVLVYTNAEGQGICVTFRQMREGEMMSSDYRERDGKLEMIRVGGYDAYLFSTKDGSSSLEWMIGQIYISLVGPVGKEVVLGMLPEGLKVSGLE